jgi:hypothetical protein
MNEVFINRVKAAAVAGWWTILAAVAFITVQWILYLVLMSAQPAWLLSLWGGDITWPFVQTVWFWFVAAFKFCLWLAFFVVLWLTIWSAQLRKRAG